VFHEEGCRINLYGLWKKLNYECTTIPQIMDFKEYRRNCKECAESWAVAGF
jgi:hypothetical protein